MEYTKFKEKVNHEFSFFGYKFTKILKIDGFGPLSDFSYGYEIVLESHERSFPFPFIKHLTETFNTPYLSVFVWDDEISINVYYK